MVLLPVLGANFLEIAGGNLKNDAGADLLPLIVGFITAYVSGLLACKWMIKIVSRGKLIYFAIYCLIIALIAIFAA
jgi:undecaprenyl-diphosphatase